MRIWSIEIIAALVLFALPASSQSLSILGGHTLPDLEQDFCKSEYISQLEGTGLVTLSYRGIVPEIPTENLQRPRDIRKFSTGEYFENMGNNYVRLPAEINNIIKDYNLASKEANQRLSDLASALPSLTHVTQLTNEMNAISEAFGYENFKYVAGFKLACRTGNNTFAGFNYKAAPLCPSNFPAYLIDRPNVFFQVDCVLGSSEKTPEETNATFAPKTRKFSAFKAYAWYGDMTHDQSKMALSNYFEENFSNCSDCKFNGEKLTTQTNELTANNGNFTLSVRKDIATYYTNIWKAKYLEQNDLPMIRKLTALYKEHLTGVRNSNRVKDF